MGSKAKEPSGHHNFFTVDVVASLTTGDDEARNKQWQLESQTARLLLSCLCFIIVTKMKMWELFRRGDVHFVNTGSWLVIRKWHK